MLKIRLAYRGRTPRGDNLRLRLILQNNAALARDARAQASRSPDFTASRRAAGFRFIRRREAPLRPYAAFATDAAPSARLRESKRRFRSASPIVCPLSQVSSSVCCPSSPDGMLHRFLRREEFQSMSPVFAPLLLRSPHFSQARCVHSARFEGNIARSGKRQGFPSAWCTPRIRRIAPAPSTMLRVSSPRMRPAPLPSGGCARRRLRACLRCRKSPRSPDRLIHHRVRNDRICAINSPISPQSGGRSSSGRRAQRCARRRPETRRRTDLLRGRYARVDAPISSIRRAYRSFCVIAFRSFPLFSCTFL
jgi:hypothetical protein